MRRAGEKGIAIVVARRVHRFAPGLGQRAHLLDLVKNLSPLVLANHHAQDTAHDANVRAELGVVCGCCCCSCENCCGRRGRSIWIFKRVVVLGKKGGVGFGKGRVSREATETTSTRSRTRSRTCSCKNRGKEGGDNSCLMVSLTRCSDASKPRRRPCRLGTRGQGAGSSTYVHCGRWLRCACAGC